MSSSVFYATKPAVRFPTCFPCMVNVDVTPDDFEASTLALRPQLTGALNTGLPVASRRCLQLLLWETSKPTWVSKKRNESQETDTSQLPRVKGALF